MFATFSVTERYISNYDDLKFSKKNIFLMHSGVFNGLILLRRKVNELYENTLDYSKEMNCHKAENMFCMFFH